MISVDDTSGTNIDVQLFDTAKIDFSDTPYKVHHLDENQKPIIFVMDYAFGEQAYETIDELLNLITKLAKLIFSMYFPFPLWARRASWKAKKAT